MGDPVCKNLLLSNILRVLGLDCARPACPRSGSHTISKHERYFKKCIPTIISAKKIEIVYSKYCQLSEKGAHLDNVKPSIICLYHSQPGVLKLCTSTFLCY